MAFRAAEVGGGGCSRPRGGGRRRRTETIETLADARNRLESLSGAFLKWTGKAEQRDVEIPTPPLFIHERHSADAILNVMREKSSSKPLQTWNLFGDNGLDLDQRIDAYDHKGGWENRSDPR